MANRRASFNQLEVTRLLKAFSNAGLPTPTIIIEPSKITAKPAGMPDPEAPNEWDEVLR